jgi:hypothetical protein
VSDPRRRSQKYRYRPRRILLEYVNSSSDGTADRVSLATQLSTQRISVEGALVSTQQC